MDNLFAIGVGLALRAVIDVVSNHNQRINGSLVGLWEGAVLHHFLYKFPSSTDPYVAYAFRLFVDFLFTTSLSRMAIVVLWSGLGVLLADVGLDLAEDSRFRRMRRRVRRMLRSLMGQSTGRTPSRVQFIHIPASSATTSSNVTARSPRSPHAQPPQTNPQQPRARPQPPPTPVPPRALSRPVPGSFSDWSETETEASRGLPSGPSPELEYVAMPSIPDLAGSGSPDTPLPAQPDVSGFTTPLTDTPDIHVHAPSSGLTTPVGSPRAGPRDDLPPVTISDEPEHDHNGEHTPTTIPADLPEIPAVPIPFRSSQGNALDDGQEMTVPLSLIDLAGPNTPGVVPPEADMPSIPDQVEREGAEPVGEPSADKPSNPPPPYENPIAVAEDKPRYDDTPSESVISGHSRNEIIKKADALRDEAQQAEKKRSQLKMQQEQARASGQIWEAFRLKVEYDQTERSARQLHEKAARRYYKAHNLKPEPHEVDVHRLKVKEAVEKVEEALYETMISGASQLRVITGRGNHSEGKIPRLKLAIIGAMKDYHITTSPDVTNPGVVLINLPAQPPAGSSTA
ncbi:hypothetical protein OBBRIDRAFT_789931 [Obba rivulosa]|uniref:Smr domain-containing protein n=1 Tax=Obba rivulosa TaxID=1052685 RepID=A0A8E2J5G7_9APHY|nr:hypothetical protein OBBRIDRAFT_789931 [Obba rivulosa]